MLKNINLLPLIILAIILSGCSSPYGIYNDPNYDGVDEPNERSTFDNTISGGPNDGMPVAEPGKCYAKCLIYDYEISTETLPIYTGSNQDAPFIQRVDNYHVVDTTMTNEYEYRDVEFSRIDESAGKRNTEWKEVVCNSNITTSLVTQVQRALINKGYDVGAISANEMNTRTKTALIQFQKDVGLPIGNLDFETLSVLEIKQ